MNYPSKTSLRPLLTPGIEKETEGAAAKRTIAFDWTDDWQENGDVTGRELSGLGQYGHRVQDR